MVVKETPKLPPLRGTSVLLDEHSLLLYTRGSVSYFRTYRGMYVPHPLLLRSSGDRTDLQNAGTDVLALSKMNWNNAQLDERDPLTLRTAHRVAAILKLVPQDAQIATRYAYYIRSLSMSRRNMRLDSTKSANIYHEMQIIAISFRMNACKQLLYTSDVRQIVHQACCNAEMDEWHKWHHN